ncbi:MAG: nickel pincer cofactor biosynthesis protein LarC [Candidatus Omnitrophica bacterium]|nr:nickel pincer cofactor biosynthesis protein LarC [Candidatus Omnitrophota bacterium]
MKVAVFDAQSGISGDMTLGAFLDAGLPLSHLCNELDKLAVKGFKLRVREVLRKSFRAKKLDVLISKAHRSEHVHWSDIKKLITKSGLNVKAKKNTLNIFTRLAKAEATVHAVSVSRIHFHEVGAIDSIVDIVGCGIALAYFGIEKIFVSHLCVGKGSVRTLHGVLPIPAPATALLLKKFRFERVAVRHELVTPTGAAILNAFGCTPEEIPPVDVDRIGIGAGDADFKERPNILRVTIGTAVSGMGKRERILALQTNMDDMLPLAYEPLSRKLFRSGALDVFVEPVYMKKQRPAYLLTVLCKMDEKQELERIILENTPTLGVRTTELSRVVLERRVVKVRTRLGPMRVKLGFLPSGKVLTASPEYADVLRIAERESMPFKRVYEMAKKSAGVLT